MVADTSVRRMLHAGRAILRRGGISTLCLLMCTALCTRLEAAPGDPPTASTPGDAPVRRVADGVSYYVQSYPKLRCTVHTVLVDLGRNDVSLKIGKGLDNIAGLERVHSIMHRYDSVTAFQSVVAGVNANYWAAGSNHPIGPTVSNGVILNNRKYKNWSALAITQSKQLYLDTFRIEAELRTRYGVMPIARFNERHDTSSIVVYNSYYGTTVPYIDTSWIAMASADTITDDSETEIGSLGAAVDSIWSISIESGSLKAQFEYLAPPVANGEVPCRITYIDTGFVMVPKNGGVISLGKGPLPWLFTLGVGDTVTLVSRLTPAVQGPVVEMTTGTPRLVRDGRVSVEWQQEGLRKLRFVQSGYGRTAFGLSRDGKRAVLVTVEPPNRRQRRKGISLPDLATLMIERGAWDAFNFDGGGSATMVVGDATVSPPAGNPYSRKISTALMVVRSTNER